MKSDNEMKFDRYLNHISHHSLNIPIKEKSQTDLISNKQYFTFYKAGNIIFYNSALIQYKQVLFIKFLVYLPAKGSYV